jgi:ABC transporter substrate binding protein
MDRWWQHSNRDTLWWRRRRPHTGSRSRASGARARRNHRPNDAGHPRATADDKLLAAVNDPVDQGFVSSLAHPGGNITGFTFIDFEMVGKWLEMLKEAAPGVSHAVLMFNPDTSPHYYVYLRSFEAVPRSIAVEVTAAPVRDTAEVQEAIGSAGRVHHRP